MTVKNQYELPELGYGYDALEPAYSAELLELHYSKHHQGYVNGANSTRKELAEARQMRDFDKIGLQLVGPHSAFAFLAQYRARRWKISIRSASTANRRGIREYRRVA